MKNFLYLLLVIACIVILGLSHFAYENKLDKIAKEAYDQYIANQEGENSNTNSDEVNSNSKETEPSSGLLGKLFDEINNDSPLKIVYFGSESIYSSDFTRSTWPELLTIQLSELVGEHLVESKIISTGDRSNVEVANEAFVTDVIESEPNLLLFEPFIRSDNGRVAIEDSLDYLTIYLNQIEEALPDTTVVLMPSNPIYNPQLYMTQITELKDFAEVNQYLYADHWQAWPDIRSEEIQDYYAGKYTNEQGHKVWAEFMYDYLTK
ncbi:SGNH/GDSL hydrolase family protein [Alkalihalobacillus sp. 1P02AB]|uniref:SGNH/GDSL hydrolase family protein n=1 Tax=Alkalihalobacillus sp. 1P02AB TaxID=3132260 RepID=UPI0039A66AFD